MYCATLSLLCPMCSTSVYVSLKFNFVMFCCFYICIAHVRRKFILYVYLQSFGPGNVVNYYRMLMLIITGFSVNCILFVIHHVIDNY